MAKQKKRQEKKNRQVSRSGKNRTPIAKHTRRGKELLPPFAASMGDKMSFTSWMDNRLPEMLWAVLIVASVDRDSALDQFRRLLGFIGEHEQRARFSDITMSGIARLDPVLRKEFIAFMIESSVAAQALVTLRLFESLPAKDSWEELLPTGDPDVRLLMNAVGTTLWHQSQKATDCRWVRLMAWVMSGKFKIPAEMAEQWFKYPNEGDQRAVRPSIRAAEGGLEALERPDLTWPNGFWKEAWQHTRCLALVEKGSPPPSKDTVTRQAISSISERLREHWESTHSTTAIDPKHDAVFGMAFYSLRILEELMGIGIGTSVLGRLGLRTICEVRINLRYLLSKDEEGLWKKWRKYGAGQAKLNALKFDDTVEPPKHIDVESIELIAGEDIWEEFLTINLAGWSGLDLRRLSERSKLKDVYDRHYSWMSGYTHGMWGPVRESCYQTCGNPLHRFHRYPERRSLNDTVDDAASLIDDILDDLGRAYPSFPHRLLGSTP